MQTKHNTMGAGAGWAARTGVRKDDLQEKWTMRADLEIGLKKHTCHPDSSGARLKGGPGF